jgi:plastocyanin
MNKKPRPPRIVLFFAVAAIVSVSFYYAGNNGNSYAASAQSIPEWVKNTALWYGQVDISEAEFLDAIKFLVENKIISVSKDNDMQTSEKITEKEPQQYSSTIIIPNSNADMGNTGFYIPLNLEVKSGTTVVWANEDAVPHTVQSIDGQGNVMSMFNSAVLNTGDRFEYEFEDPGVYNYYCSFHPWRVGSITVS